MEDVTVWVLFVREAEFCRAVAQLADDTYIELGLPLFICFLNHFNMVT
jgi:hypothetical protein